MVDLNFKEFLPEQCPPFKAGDEALNNVCRFLPFSPPEDDGNYKSHAELGKKTGNASECRARSCSLFRFNHVVKQAMKIGAFKKMKVAVLNIPAGSGLHVDGGRHIDFWMASDFEPANSIAHLCDGADEVEQALSDV